MSELLEMGIIDAYAVAVKQGQHRSKQLQLLRLAALLYRYISITHAIDSLGRVFAMLGDGSNESQGTGDVLHVEILRYLYDTWYSRFGDLPVFFLFLCFAFANLTL